jgi:hypothetical protein
MNVGPVEIQEMLLSLAVGERVFGVGELKNLLLGLELKKERLFRYQV